MRFNASLHPGMDLARRWDERHPALRRAGTTVVSWKAMSDGGIARVLHPRSIAGTPRRSAAVRTPRAFLRLSVACATASVLASAGTAGAQVEDRLAECARIAGSSERLECYDALSKAGTAAATDFWNRALGPDASRKSPAAAASTTDPDPVTQFGFNDGRGSGAAQQVQSRYDGEFTGWSGNTLFRLENGQVWKQAQSGRVSARATRPQITIKRGTLGGYRMNVEGLNESIRVERVK
jgi:hypothetical protein